MQEELLKVELGCGHNKAEGFVGVDRLPFDGVDIVADLNHTFPFEDNSVDVLYLCHFLEHVADILHAMDEIYRICRHKAIIMLIAPYHNTYTNIANPYHYIPFNEHTFRFFSNTDSASIDTEDYYCPHAINWALGRGDNSDNKIEIAQLSMEFFYFDEYTSLGENEKRRARHSLSNVCDQIYYILAVNKDTDAFTMNEEKSLLAKAQGLEPSRINSLRSRKAYKPDRINIIDDIRRPIYDLIHETDRAAKNSFQSNISSVREEYKRLLSDFMTLREEQKNLFINLMTLQEEQKNLLINFMTLQEEQKNLLVNFMTLQEEQKNFQSNVSGKINNESIYLNTQTRLYSSMFLDIIRSNEYSRWRKISIYRKQNDISPNISPVYKDFIYKVKSSDKFIGKKYIISFSKVILFSEVTAYRIKLSGGGIKLFFTAMASSSVLIEIVKKDNIVYRESLLLSGEMIHPIVLNEHGEAELRLRTNDTHSVVRVLEVHTKHRFLFYKRNLAYHTTQ